MVTSEEEVVAGPDSKGGEGMTFEGRHVSAADTVVIRFEPRRPASGSSPGIAPTGRRIWWGSVRLVWIKDARVIGQWAQLDLWNIYRQLTVPG